MTEKEIIKGCRKSNRQAQRKLYEVYSKKMMGVCRRYIKQKEIAEEVLINGFLKVYQNIKSFKYKGSFEGWIRKIMVNEALTELRKKYNLQFQVEINERNLAFSTQNKQSLMEKDILKLLQYLPVGCRTIFNLYVLEGYKHHEIAQMAGISENTSKSQLALARKKLQILILQFNIIKTKKIANNG